MKDLSVIIVSYNTKDITVSCLKSLTANLQKADVESQIIVVDNNSSDDSSVAAKEYADIALALPDNIGYSKANNKGLEKATGKYILFLNSDVIIDSINFAELVKFMDEYSHVGALTVRVNLENGQIDPASHRGFPTIWRSFCYFSGLETLFAPIPVLNALFGGYHLLGHNLDTPHDIDSPSGAFFLTRKSLMDALGGFDEEFFMYGEDIDLAFRIKQLGYSVEYLPQHTVTHLKYSSGLKHADTDTRKKVRVHFYEAMKIFYRKHYEDKNPALINRLVYSFIDLRKNFL